MIENLEISGYRCFPKFQMNNLGRVNLIVGTNNSGKTCLLEAISLLFSRGDPRNIASILRRRGERVTENDDLAKSDDRLFDLAHLFTGHKLKIGSHFIIRSNILSAEHSVQFRVLKGDPSKSILSTDQTQLFSDLGKVTNLQESLLMEISSTTEKSTTGIPLSITESGGIRELALLNSSLFYRDALLSLPPIRMITTESLSTASISSLWRTIALTPQEDRIIEALQIIEPTIERIAVVSESRTASSRLRGGVMVRMRGVGQPIPIGSLGDGMWRMLALASSLVTCQKGAILIDEIDTGLHYTVMEDMWKMIARIADQLEIQVFATTHSSDCVSSLAAICQENSDINSTASLQRVEKDSEQSIAFTEKEIAIAARRGIEVR